MRRSSSMNNLERKQSHIPQLKPSNRRSSQERLSVRPSLRTPLTKLPRSDNPSNYTSIQKMRRSSSMNNMERKQSQIPQLQPQASTRRSSSQVRPSSIRPSSLRTPLPKSPRTKSPRPDQPCLLSYLLVEKSALNRRSSVNRLSLLDKKGAKDHRNLADKGYQGQVLRKLSNFLMAQNCHFSISTKLNPHSFKKEFQDTFLFLIHFFDLYFQVTCDEDILSFLKFLNYPNLLTKSYFSATSLNSCHKLLHVLDWLVDTFRFTSDIENYFIQRKDCEFNKPVQKQLLDRVCRSYELYVKEGREENNEEAFDRILQGTFESLDGIPDKEEEFHKLKEMREDLSCTCFHHEEKLQEFQTLRDDFDKLTVYVDNQRQCNEEDAEGLAMQEDLLEKLQADFRVAVERMKEAEAKLVQQKAAFSLEVFKTHKSQFEEKFQQLRVINRELEEEWNRREVALSKESFEILNHCAKMELRYNKNMEQTRNLLKEELEIPPFPFQKTQKKNVGEAVENVVQKWKLLKGKMRMSGDRQMELANCLKNVQSQKEALDKVMRDAHKQHEQQLGKLVREDHKLEEDIKTLEMEVELKQEELTKVHPSQAATSGLKRAYIQAKRQLGQLQQQNSKTEQKYTLHLQTLEKELASQIQQMEEEKQAFLEQAQLKIKKEVLESL